jgi:hypothetical protein
VLPEEAGGEIIAGYVLQGGYCDERKGGGVLAVVEVVGVHDWYRCRPFSDSKGARGSTRNRPVLWAWGGLGRGKQRVPRSESQLVKLRHITHLPLIGGGSSHDLVFEINTIFHYM